MAKKKKDILDIEETVETVEKEVAEPVKEEVKEESKKRSLKIRFNKSGWCNETESSYRKNRVHTCKNIEEFNALIKYGIEIE